MIIRKAKKEDFNGIFDLLLQLSIKNKKAKAKIKKSYEQSLKLRDSFDIVAIENKEIVGYASGGLCYALWARGYVFWIHELVTTKKYRRKGIAKRLIMELERIAKKRKAKQMFLATQKERKPAISLYSRMNYVPSKNYYLRKFF